MEQALPRRDAEVVVVGAGIMGLAAAAAIARTSAVVVLEQFAPGHTRGSSHGTVRIFKVSYPEPEFVRLAQASVAGWRALEEESGTELLATTGTIDVGGIAGRREALAACGAESELMRAAEVERRFGLRIDDDGDALFQPDGGILHADRAQSAFLGSALRRGAQVVYETPVLDLVPEDDGVLVRTPAGELRADAVVVTAGAWVTRLLAPLGLAPDVVPVRETVAYLRPRTAGHGPPLSEWLPDEGLVTYGVVGRDGLLKVGVSGSGTPTDPAGRGTVDDAVVERAAAWARRRYDLADAEPVGAETCLYTNAPDERFVVERRGRIVIGSPCSGHGFKFAPAVGARLAELASEAAGA